MRGIRQMPGIRDIKSIHSVGARSIPKVKRSGDLELYILRREKDRLEREIFEFDKRISTVNRQLNIINNRIEKLQEEVHEEQKIKTYRGISTRPLKTMKINY